MAILDLVVACCLANPNLGIMADEAAKAYKIDPLLFHSVIIVESNYKPNVVNKTVKTWSYGLAQVTKESAKFYCRLEDVLNPRQNLLCGAKILRHQLDRYHNTDKALSAYNAGSYTPKNWMYVKKVRDQMLEIEGN